MGMKNWVWLGLPLSALLILAGCNQPSGDAYNNTEAQKRTDIKPAVKLGTDASKVGMDTYQFISVVDSLPNTATPNRTQFEQLIFQPSRQLLIRWGTEVSQKDSAVGDKYTICKGALVSLNTWARAVIDQQSNAASKQQIYQNQKQLCAQAVNSR